jgi:hypothetical protein
MKINEVLRFDTRTKVHPDLKSTDQEIHFFFVTDYSDPQYKSFFILIYQFSLVDFR